MILTKEMNLKTLSYTFDMKKIILIILTLFLSGCGAKAPGIAPPFVIYPYEFYERFNLRTILSSYTGDLKYFCASYPKDFFRPDELYMPNMDKIIIQNETKRLSFELFTEDKVIVTDETLDGSYNAKYLFKIYYNEEHDDFRTDRFFIQKRENCQEYRLKPKPKTQKEEEK